MATDPRDQLEDLLVEYLATLDLYQAAQAKLASETKNVSNSHSRPLLAAYRRFCLASDDRDSSNWLRRNLRSVPPELGMLGTI